MKQRPVIDALRQIQVRPTYLGRYREADVLGKIQMIRDDWQTGERFASRDFKTVYAVAPSGQLVRVTE